MENLEAKPIESILERKEIIAPPNFVSVFHETKEEFLPSIDTEGLRSDIEIRNIGVADAMARRNAKIDNLRPDELKAKGISRNNIYAYPFLEYGHGLIGADQRFIKQNEEYLRSIFVSMQSQSPDYLQNLGVNTADEYVRKKTDHDYLKSQYPGEVLELKVDPQRCYIGDLEYITRIMDDINRGLAEEEAVQQQAEAYWKNMMTLEDFFKWYKKPEWAQDGDSIKDADEYRDGEPLGTSGFYPIKGAPDSLPPHIHQPEILVSEDIPQEYIRVLK